MIKRVLGILVVSVIMFSCASKTEKKEACCDKEITTITVDQVMADLQSYVDKNIVIEGIVNHVCSHGGKRMFIMGEDPDVAIKITPNEKIGVFEKELEGSFVIVTGMVKELRINEDYVVSLEKEGNEVAKAEAMHDHSAGTHDEDAENEQKAQIEAMRTQISESENGYYSQYWIEAVKFEVKEYEHEQDESEENMPTKEEGHDDDHDHEHAEGEGHSR
ncbi:MAG: hypothetical protein PF485_01360 [Bacteroidales bacterium]|jgi:hypothetical protein|nr:hypothetical protein [Bacteroidales bacterium]